MGEYRRGIRSLRNLFGEEETVADRKKGRNAELQAEKDECLCYRYYYYTVIHSIKIYEQRMEVLSREFWLSKDTIPRIIEEHEVLMKRLKNELPTVELLQEKYPWIVWAAPVAKNTVV